MFCEWSFIGTQHRPFIVCCLRLLPTSLSGCDQDRLALRDCSCLVSNRESLGAPGLGRSRGPALLFLLVVICLGVWSLYSVKFLLSGPVTLPCMYKIPSPFGFPSHLGRGFPRGSDSEQSACNPGDPERSPAGGNGYPLQYSHLENSTERGAWCGSWWSPWGRKESATAQ